MKPLIFLFFFIFCLFFGANSQQAPVAKFGHVDIAELELKIYEPDPEAAAVVLFDEGQSIFVYNQTTGFEIVFTRHKRIKVLTKDGYGWGDVEIPLYKSSGGEKESLQKYNGFTYNLVDGKIEKTKLEKSMVFKEDLNENWDISKLVFPNVREGSIIEVQYTVSSPFSSQLRSWEFQDRIPVIWSEYTTKVPEYYNYLKFTQGYEPFAVVDETSEFSTITLRYIERGEGYATNSTPRTETVNLTNKITRLVAVNLPAFKDESFISRPEDYFLKIEYQLSSTKWPNKPVNKILSDWHEVEARLLEHHSFGEILKKRTLYRAHSETINATTSSEIEKVLLARKLILEAVVWNGKNRMLASENTDVIKSKSGSSADINLFFIGLLKELGVTAYPVILSTRNNGKVHPVHPLIDKYNYVIAQVVVEGKEYLIDLTDPFIPFGLLPERCLNELGRRIDKVNSGWVNLNVPVLSTQSYSVELDVSTTGVLTGLATKKLGGYYALESKKDLAGNGETEYKNKIASKIEEWMISEITVEDGKEEVSFAEKFKLQASSDPGGPDILYIEPMPFLKMNENPFKQEERMYPIDYRFPTRNVLMAKIVLPENYKVEELPQSKTFALPDRGGLFNFNVTSSDNTITIYSRFDINKSMYLPDQYLFLKAAYDQILAAHSQQIVLRKQ